MLPILKYTDLFDFQKEGNFNNYKLGLATAPQDSLLSWKVRVDKSFVIKYLVHRVEIQANEVVITYTYDFTFLRPLQSENGWLYQSSEIELGETLPAGLYFYELVGSFGRLKSELFCIKEGLFLHAHAFTTGFSLGFDS